MSERLVGSLRGEKTQIEFRFFEHFRKLVRREHEIDGRRAVGGNFFTLFRRAGHHRDHYRLFTVPQRVEMRFERFSERTHGREARRKRRREIGIFTLNIMYPSGTEGGKQGQIFARFQPFLQLVRFPRDEEIRGERSVRHDIRTQRFEPRNDFSHCVFSARHAEFFAQSHADGGRHLDDHAGRLFVRLENLPRLVRFVLNRHGSRRAYRLAGIAVNHYVTHLS